MTDAILLLLSTAKMVSILAQTQHEYVPPQQIEAGRVELDRLIETFEKNVREAT